MSVHVNEDSGLEDTIGNGEGLLVANGATNGKSNHKMSIAGMLSSSVENSPETPTDDSYLSGDLLASFKTRLQNLVELDQISLFEVNTLKFLKEEFGLMNDLKLEQSYMLEGLKDELLVKDSKIIEKLVSREKLIKEDSLKKDDFTKKSTDKKQDSDALAKPKKKRRAVPANMMMDIAPADFIGTLPAKRKRPMRKPNENEVDPDTVDLNTGRKKVKRAPRTEILKNGARDANGDAEADSKDAEKDDPKMKYSSKEQKAIDKQYDNTFLSIWKDLARKDGPKAYRQLQQSEQAKMINFKKTAQLASRESKRWQIKTNKSQKDLQTRARRATREMLNYWKRNEREERDLRKKAEKKAIDKAKKEEEEHEAKRQSRKLNFLITQTELYSHFIGKKIKTDEFEGNMADSSITNGATVAGHDGNVDISHAKSDFNSIDFDAHDDETLRLTAAANAQAALMETKQKAEAFNGGDKNADDEDEMNFQNPTSLGEIAIDQPKLLNCTLKEYQMKGLNWLANLYDQGINGILADEMGLGKTVQSISVLAYLAETHNIWGPFLVVTPASTLHNWQQEITRFVPDFKVLPYWGNSKDRKVLRKFWDRKNVVYNKSSPFHVLVTSYQLIVADAQYFQKVKWQYMILDEAQAIKSSQSSRWKSLLSLQCRNRLLLTGTPIQNTMQELWALLHFIMPSLFDSHDEFSEWFSKDIESHAQSNTQLNQQQLKRLHVILKPFMLRRIKKNVQSELGDKIEIDVFCELTNRQKTLYKMLRSQVSLIDLLENNAAFANSNPGELDSDFTSDSLMNLVMQFRKVCNHPDLFERADTRSAFNFGKFAETSSFLREAATNNGVLEFTYNTTNEIQYSIPKLIFDEILSVNYNNEIKDLEFVTNSKLNVWSNAYIQESSQQKDGIFTWLPFINSSPADVVRTAKQSTLKNAIDLKTYSGNSKQEMLNRLEIAYADEYKLSADKSLFLINRGSKASVFDDSELKELYSIQKKVDQDMYFNVTSASAFPVVSAPPIDVVCHKMRFGNILQDTLFDKTIRTALAPLDLNLQYELLSKKIPIDEFPKAEMLPQPISSSVGYTSISLPSMKRFVIESGKLSKLDQMLVDLKANDHKVLIYFQMTKMMDLMEEFLTYRQYKYIRLDGSSKLSDRRDLVHDWQTKPELFIFLLSTRAGGLGINLTAADTVIFYDSDWNPTIDSQAMDRAHRLGQTRQVTVYRLLTRNTIEERMRNRAKQKEHVQQVVMEGKSGPMPGKTEKKDASKREVAMWLLDKEDDEDDSSKTVSGDGDEGDGNVQIDQDTLKLEELYHEGEGRFDSGTVTPSVQ
ncbi:unnamed protein product [Kuraishia capsulata CBS 1993]|uniref:Chromatin-remodeling ATPase INO80 n=1 Tax=Kuraishia capsulata CBS 1993 TaxID=1382522 RepID=W6MH26_9ASCO|nr:uncharacterized protein KUCA_T00001208001 [Kuraishia capsulata CBS 1993]CDK25241.1 unnamed protein product [Kuraishia capsulata CBS 1993]